ncbi:MAG: DUF3592 domain-containing protein [Planctomycetes bacterium]|nr:DUF3592 domain-containing protein [Planctomycetota bacterium]
MKRIRTGRIILNDYPSFLLTIGGPVFLGVGAFVMIFGFIPPTRYGRGGQQVDPLFGFWAFATAAVVASLMLVLLAARLARMKAILTSGPRATATVLRIEFFRDRGRVEYEYVHEGRTIASGSAIMKNRTTSALSPGDDIEVAIDPARPNRALPVQLFEA